MDYGLLAPKLLAGQLAAAEAARRPDGSAVHSLGGLRFQRVWLQGMLVPSGRADGALLLDDGSGLVALAMAGSARAGLRVGMYVLVLGALFPSIEVGGDGGGRGGNAVPLVKVHKLVDLSATPDREAIWALEVIEAHQLFYQALRL
eukprot:SM000375S13736  [mRNA]  locus=s375:12115:12552:- [translate_table: standard]